jgi:signal transduction histidine kinase/ligand-binding sensor domain-containing protein/AraC-like DNA-binding protein
MKALSYILPLFIGAHMAAAQSHEDFVFTHINTNDGLSQNTARSLCTDTQGFMWIGTLDGLNRYDGNSFISYKPRQGEPNTLSDPRIKNINLGPDGLLWVRTYDNSVCCFDPKTDNFISITNDNGQRAELYHTNIFFMDDEQTLLYGSNGAVSIKTTKEGRGTIQWSDTTNQYNAIVKDVRGDLWLSGNVLTRIKSNGTINSYNIMGEHEANKMCIVGDMIVIVCDNNELIRFDTSRCIKLNSILFNKDVRLLYCNTADEHTVLLSSRDHGLFAYDTSRENVLSGKEIGAETINKNAVLISDNKGGVWIGDHSGVIHKFATDKRNLESIRVLDPSMVSAVDNERFIVYIDSKNRRWISSYGGGISMYDTQNNKQYTLRYNGTEQGLTSDYVLSITEDSYGNIWVGTEYAGITKITPRHFNILNVLPEETTTLGASNNVRMLYEDDLGHIWVGTKNGSLYIYDNTLNNMLFNQKGINPYSILDDKKGNMWIGTKGNGILVYDKNTMKVKAHHKSEINKPQNLCHNSVFSLIMDHHDNIWVGTFGGGLDLVRSDEKGEVTFMHFFNKGDNKSFVRSLIEDHAGNIWMATYDGLIGFVPDELIRDADDYIHYQYDPNEPSGLNCKDVKTILEDSKHQLWIGTAGGGLNKLTFKKGKATFEKFTTEQGLPSDIVVSMICYNDSMLWLGTENGLAQFNMNTNTIYNHLLSNGTHGNYFNDNAAIKRSNDHLLWGTLNGLLGFDPENLNNKSNKPKPIITAFSINGQNITPTTENSPLKNAISETKELQLEYDQNSFIISFATLNMTNPDENKYTFMLSGFDNKWSVASKNHSAVYKQVPPGEYTFMVRNIDDKPSDYTKLKITIIAPWYRTNTALCLYLVIILLILITIGQITTKINRLRNSIAMEHELTDYKLRFFTNISHEFRTPLTLIKGTVESLVEDSTNLSDETKSHIDKLLRNTRQMSRLIDQLLEFRKIQNNVLTLNLEETDISAYVTDIFNSFTDIAEQKNINFTLDIPPVWNILIDRNKVEKIIYNYLSNALKFTPEKGSITVKIEKLASGNCLISVKDTGCGIPKNKQNLIFKRFMQVNFSANGTGVGLSLVKEFAESHHAKASYADNPGGGSIFSLELPTDYSAFNDINIIIPQNTNNESNVTAALKDINDSDTKNTILVIDDNKDIRDFLCDRLSANFHVLPAQNGQEGLNVVAEHTPDLIICDVKMPIMDGLEFTQQIRADINLSHLPIILLTAHPSDTLQIESSESGADEYIMKPFNFRYLLSRINKLIEQREMLYRRFSENANNKEIDTHEEHPFKVIIEEILERKAHDFNFSIEDLMSELNLSRSNIYKKIKDVAGCTPGEYIKAWRMNKAYTLLKKGTLNVMQVAHAVGMEDQFYFSKCFKKQFGCSPSKVAKSIFTPNEENT